MHIALIILLVLASTYDLKYRVIPDYISLLIFLVGLFYEKIYFGGILLACIILAICLTIDGRYKGGGDIKLIGAIGLVIGFVKILYLYIISETLIYLFRILFKRHKKEEIPYAPFILISSILILI